jgi:hypothetical protein
MPFAGNLARDEFGFALGADYLRTVAAHADEADASGEQRFDCRDSDVFSLATGSRLTDGHPEIQSTAQNIFLD